MSIPNLPQIPGLNVQESNVFTMSSLDFLKDYINPARLDAGESEVRPADFLARIKDELSDENLNYENFVVGKTGHKSYYAMLNHDQMMLVGMRESKQVRKLVLAKLKLLAQPQQTSTGNLMLDAMIETQRQVTEQKQRMDSLEASINSVVKKVDNFKVADKVPPHMATARNIRAMSPYYMAEKTLKDTFRNNLPAQIFNIETPYGIQSCKHYSITEGLDLLAQIDFERDRVSRTLNEHPLVQGRFKFYVK